ncbi:MAG: S1C family serine protease, partial [Candidatus Dormibacteria bacterium]
HYGPVQRVVYQQISGSTSTQTQTIGQLAQANAGSVVTIATQPVTATEVADGTASLVDGVVVSSDGLILTSAQALEGATQYRVGLADGQGYDAVPATGGVDATHGLAVLRITGVSNLDQLPLAASAPAVGDQAIVLSRPASGGLSVEVGDVSAVGVTVTTATSSADGGGPTTVQGAISIGAISDPGADGAPVLNAAGDLIGIVDTITQAPSPPGITALSLSAAANLIAGVSGGTGLAQGTFGVVSGYLDPARAAATGLTPGDLITSVDAGGPAAAAGLQVGDVVTAVNGIAVVAGDSLAPVAFGLSPGDTAEVTVVRGATTQTIAVQVGPLPTPAPGPS